MEEEGNDEVRLKGEGDKRSGPKCVEGMKGLAKGGRI